MKDKFQTLQPWLSQVLHTIKKEIKTEHLSKSPAFYKTHFGNRPINRITNEEMCAVYEKELLANDTEELGEWVINRWVFRNGDIYQHFASRLAQINPDFEEIKNLDDKQSEMVLSGAIEAFGALPVYLFVVLNGVVISPKVLERLKNFVVETQEKEKEEQEALSTQMTLDQMIERQKAEILRLEKKYEDKLLGVMKKYTTDIEALKNQVRSLQHKINGK
jgi:hypothetical protein